MGSRAAEVAVTDPATSDGWDLGLYATNVMLNGGDAGPGGAAGYCVCQNADATDAQVMEMTAENQLPDFEAVTTAHLPATASRRAVEELETAYRVLTRFVQEFLG
mgnify:CR=1 FL=1